MSQNELPWTDGQELLGVSAEDGSYEVRGLVDCEEVLVSFGSRDGTSAPLVPGGGLLLPPGSTEVTLKLGAAVDLVGAVLLDTQEDALVAGLLSVETGPPGCRRSAPVGPDGGYSITALLVPFEGRIGLVANGRLLAESAAVSVALPRRPGEAVSVPSIDMRNKLRVQVFHFVSGDGHGIEARSVRVRPKGSSESVTCYIENGRGRVVLLKNEDECEVLFGDGTSRWCSRETEPLTIVIEN
ncbi:MAG: hypothetical protein HY812_03435 [Planctomycetes bacterium]|nr:hypothetical protein [Planctomycetota bacterium]